MPENIDGVNVVIWRDMDDGLFKAKADGIGVICSGRTKDDVRLEIGQLITQWYEDSGSPPA